MTIYIPETGLRVTLSSSMINMEHHPCVSFFLWHGDKAVISVGLLLSTSSAFVVRSS